MVLVPLNASPTSDAEEVAGGISSPSEVCSSCWHLSFQKIVKGCRSSLCHDHWPDMAGATCAPFADLFHLFPFTKRGFATESTEVFLPSFATLAALDPFVTAIWQEFLSQLAPMPGHESLCLLVRSIWSQSWRFWRLLFSTSFLGISASILILYYYYYTYYYWVSGSLRSLWSLSFSVFFSLKWLIWTKWNAFKTSAFNGRIGRVPAFMAFVAESVDEKKRYIRRQLADKSEWSQSHAGLVEKRSAATNLNVARWKRLLLGSWQMNMAWQLANVVENSEVKVSPLFCCQTKVFAIDFMYLFVGLVGGPMCATSGLSFCHGLHLKWCLVMRMWWVCCPLQPIPYCRYWWYGRYRWYSIYRLYSRISRIAQSCSVWPYYAQGSPGLHLGSWQMNMAWQLANVVENSEVKVSPLFCCQTKVFAIDFMYLFVGLVGGPMCATSGLSFCHGLHLKWCLVMRMWWVCCPLQPIPYCRYWWYCRYRWYSIYRLYSRISRIAQSCSVWPYYAQGSPGLHAEAFPHP